jgi:hypothetical protein
MDDNEKQKQREAWRVYAAAALPIVYRHIRMDEDHGYGNSDIAEQSGWVADFMLAEENKRFGGDDENL